MIFQIAWRNLWRNRMRSILIATSVAIGMWAGAFIIAIYFGMGNGRLRIAIDHEVSHIQVHHPQFSADQEPQFYFNADSLRSILQEIPGIKAFSLRSITTGMLATASGSQGVQINGITPSDEQATRQLGTFVREGAYLDTSMRSRILVSSRLADKIKLRVGQKVVLTFLDTASNITSGAFRVCGLYTSENGPLDERNVFILKTSLDEQLGLRHEAHEAALLLQRDGDLAGIYDDLLAKLPGFDVKKWQDISPETSLVISSLDSYAIIYIVIILIALAFGIINTMLMAVIERTREIGVLMAVGMNKARIFSMVMLETIMLTLIGAPAGLFVAWLCVLWLGRTGIDLSAVAGEVMRGFGYASVIYPQLPIDSIWQIVRLVILAAVLSAIFPALKALKLKPVEAIRV